MMISDIVGSSSTEVLIFVGHIVNENCKLPLLKRPTEGGAPFLLAEM